MGLLRFFYWEESESFSTGTMLIIESGADLV